MLNFGDFIHWIKIVLEVKQIRNGIEGGGNSNISEVFSSSIMIYIISKQDLFAYEFKKKKKIHLLKGEKKKFFLGF